MNAPPWLRGGRAAMIFLTRIPIGGFPFSKEDWQWSSGYFPLVGVVLGVLHATVFLLTERAGAFAAACVAMTVGLLLTGAFHEDGLADTADAMGGTYDRTKLFEILKDSRVGSFGAVALVSVFLTKAALFARLGHSAALAMVVTQCVSRMPPIWLMATTPYVTQDEASKSKLVTRATWKQAALASLWPSVLCYAFSQLYKWMSPMLVGTLAATCVVVAVLCTWRFRKRVGGITGDFLGACQQVTECALLLAWAIYLGPTSNGV
jgi:adenosylcobinamide-GDP ribazoletransferase